MAGFDVNNTLGVVFLGVSVSSMIYGITCLQTFNYYLSSRAKIDGTWMHILVATLLILDSFHQFLVIHATYRYLILDFANPLALITDTVWSVPTEILLNGVLAFILNSFLTVRLWRVCGRVSLTVLATFLTLANIVVNIAYGIRSFEHQQIYLAALHTLRLHGIAGLAIGVSTDFYLAGTLCFYLYRSRTGFSRSDGIITRLIALTITTGLLTSLCNLADLIAYVFANNNLYVLFFNFMLSKLYANALLTSLNTRSYIQGLVQNHSLASSATSGAVVEATCHDSSDVHYLTTRPGEPVSLIHITGEKQHAGDASQALGEV